MPSIIPEPSPAGSIDHTLLRPQVTAAQIGQLCEEAVEEGFAAVCVPPNQVRHAAGCLYGASVTVATVVGFPFGYTHPAVKAFEAAQAVADGAGELDMVLSLGDALAGDLQAVEDDITAVVRAAASAPVKVILECCLLPRDLFPSVVEVCVAAGAAYVKTSTGFAAGGATLEDVRLLHRLAAGRLDVKASAGIRDWPTCRAMLAAGAQRIGTSAGMDIMRQWRSDQQE